MYGVQARLRSGDVWVPGSRRYTDPTTLLIPAESWVAKRDDFCAVTGTEANPQRQLQRLEAELHAAGTDLEQVLADPNTQGLARLDEDGDLIVSPLPAEQVPAQADALAQAVAARLPQIHLPALPAPRGPRLGQRPACMNGRRALAAQLEQGGVVGSAGRHAHPCQSPVKSHHLQYGVV